MFGFRKFFQLSAVAAVAVLMTACSGEEKEKVAGPSKGNMIPENAVVAIKADPAQLWEKLTSDPSVQGVVGMVKMGIAANVNELGQLGNIAGDFIKDPAVLGVNMSEPVVVSASFDVENNGIDVYLTAQLNDSKAFVKVVDAFVKYAKSEGGLAISKENVNDTYTYYKANPDRGVYAALGVADKGAVLHIHNSMTINNAKLRKSTLALFSNGGPAKTDALKDFYGTKADAAFWLDIDNVVTSAYPVLKQADPMLASQLKSTMPLIEGSAAVVDLAFNDGQTVASLKTYGSEQMKANALKYNTPASDKFFKYVPASAAAVVNIAIKDFPGLIDELCKTNEEYKLVFEQLESEFGVTRRLLAGMPGTMTFAIDGENMDDYGTPGFVACLECDKNVWEFAEEYIASVAEPVGDGAYCIDGEAYLFYDGDHVTLVDAETLENSPIERTYSFAGTALGREIRKGGVALNLAALPSGFLREGVRALTGMNMSASEALELCSSIVLTMSDDFMSATLTMNMDDEHHNLLEKVLLCAMPM